MSPKQPIIILEASQDWVPYEVVLWAGLAPKVTTLNTVDNTAKLTGNKKQRITDHHADAQIHTKCHLHQLQAF